MLKFIKGQDVKFVDPQSTLIRVLKEQGWEIEGAEKSVAVKSEVKATKPKAEKPKVQKAA